MKKFFLALCTFGLLSLAFMPGMASATSCTSDADCSGGTTCQQSSFSQKQCLPPPTGQAGSQTTPAPAASGVVSLTNPLNVKDIPTIIGNIIRTAVGIVGALALLMFIYGGFIWLTSRGEAAKVEEGKNAMKWAAIGLVIIFTSYALVTFALTLLTQA